MKAREAAMARKAGIKKGDTVKINPNRLLKSFAYLKNRIYTVSNLQQRGNEYYAILSPGYLYINTRALIKLTGRVISIERR